MGERAAVAGDEREAVDLGAAAAFVGVQLPAEEHDVVAACREHAGGLTCRPAESADAMLGSKNSFERMPTRIRPDRSPPLVPFGANASGTLSVPGRRLERGAPWRRRREVVVALVESDLRHRYGRGRLRGLKWVLDPFAAVGVYLLLVAFAVEREAAAPGLSIACAVVPFQLVIMTIANALSAIETRAAIIANMAIDTWLLPIASAFTELIGFIAALLLLALMMVVYGVAPTAAVLLLPVVVFVTLAAGGRVRLPGARCSGRGSARRSRSSSAARARCSSSRPASSRSPRSAAPRTTCFASTR